MKLKKIPNSSGIFPEDSDIPLYIRDDVQKMGKEIIEKQKLQEALRNKLDLKISYKNEERTVHLLRSSTLQELFDEIWFQFSLFKESQFLTCTAIDDDDKKENDEENHIEKEKNTNILSERENSKNDINNIDDDNKKDNITSKIIKSDKLPTNDLETPQNPVKTGVTSSIVQYGEMRLRYFNITTKIPTDVFDIKSRTKTLESLGFSSYRYLMLQIKEKNEIWEEYYSDGFNILLEGFNSVTNDFCPVRSVRMAKNSTLKDLRKVIQPWVDYPASEIR